jgi:hypothetical protein
MWQEDDMSSAAHAVMPIAAPVAPARPLHTGRPVRAAGPSSLAPILADWLRPPQPPSLLLLLLYVRMNCYNIPPLR